MTEIISDVELCCLEVISILLGVRPFYIVQLYSKVGGGSKVKSHETREVIKLPVAGSPKILRWREWTRSSISIFLEDNRAFYPTPRLTVVETYLHGPYTSLSVCWHRTVLLHILCARSNLMLMPANRGGSCLESQINLR